MSRRLVELSGPAVSSRLTEDSVLVLPTGAVEHHGAHLPLATDAIMAEEVGGAVVERAVATRVDAWVLPTLTYTKSDEHHWAPGTMWLRAETLMETLVDLGNSLTSTPAKKLVFFNGHGGNTALLQVAMRELRRRFGLETFFTSVRAPVKDDAAVDEQGFGIHGGHSETSLMMHLRPDLVDLTQARRAVPEKLLRTPMIGFHSTPVTFGWLSNDFGPEGIIGDPTGANAAHGAELYEAAVAQGAEALGQVAQFCRR